MKYNAVYKCPLCGSNLIMADVTIDVTAKRDVESQVEWWAAIYGIHLEPYKIRIDHTHMLCFCDDGRVGYAPFSGLTPAEEKL